MALCLIPIIFPSILNYSCWTETRVIGKSSLNRSFSLSYHRPLMRKVAEGCNMVIENWALSFDNKEVNSLLNIDSVRQSPSFWYSIYSCLLLEWILGGSQMTSAIFSYSYFWSFRHQALYHITSLDHILPWSSLRTASLSQRPTQCIFWETLKY